MSNINLSSRVKLSLFGPNKKSIAIMEELYNQLIVAYYDIELRFDNSGFIVFKDRDSVKTSILVKMQYNNFNVTVTKHSKTSKFMKSNEFNTLDLAMKFIQDEGAFTECNI